MKSRSQKQSTRANRQKHVRKTGPGKHPNSQINTTKMPIDARITGFWAATLSPALMVSVLSSVITPAAAQSAAPAADPSFLETLRAVGLNFDALAAIHPETALFIHSATVIGAVGMAIGFFAFVLRNQLHENGIIRRLKARLRQRDASLHWVTSLVEASPQIAFVWEGAALDQARTEANGAASDEADPKAKKAPKDDQTPALRRKAAAERAVEARVLGETDSLKEAKAKGNDTPPPAALSPKVLGSSIALGRVLGAGQAPQKLSEGAPVCVFDHFMAGLEEDDKERLLQAVRALKLEGVAFSFKVTSRIGQVFQAEGAPVGRKAVLWLHDLTTEIQSLERLQAELADMTRQRDALAEILNAAPIPIWHRSQENALAWVNEAYAKAVEHEVDQVIEKGVELHDRLGPLADEAIEHQAPAVDNQHAVINGSRRSLELLSMPLAEGTAGMAFDRTDAEDARTDLDRHIGAHRETLNSLTTAVAIFGSDQRLAFFNRAFTRLWHLDDDWLHTEPKESAVLDRLRDERRLPEQADFPKWKKDWLARYNNLIKPEEDVFSLPDRRTLKVSCHPHPFGGLIYLYEDVTDQVALESSYNRLINVQRATLDNLFEGVAVFGSDGRLKLHNAEFSKIWNLGAEDLEGEPHIDLIEKWCRRQVDTLAGWNEIKVRVTAANDERSSAQGEIQRKDGSILRYLTVPLPDGRTLISYVDITDGQRMERALRERNDALETAAKLKSGFVEHVSYQLRTPLTAIRGFGEMMQQGIGGPLSDRQQEYTQNILQASQELEIQVNDILDLATIEAGAMALDVSDVDIQRAATSAVDLARKKALDAKLTLKLICGESIGKMPLDERRLKQSLYNLITNAIHHTPQGGEITVELERAGGQLRILVQDTGSGISLEDQPLVFDRFECFGKQKRAGLGLSLVRSFTELHGGWVALESKPGAGTRVTIYLPDQGLQIAAE